MQNVVKVKFRNSGRCYYFDALDFDIHDGMNVIVNTTHGDMLGIVSGEPTEMDEARLSSQLKPVIRIATQDDLSQMQYYQSKEDEALAICKSKIEARGLAMKLVDAEYAFNGSKLTFYFTADNRVDFRELLKDLTAVFKARIDLRQIGDRDEAKKCGGLGFCGRPVCCNTFLSEFTPVSIKMAKTQNLSLNPLKISGICGKLMCCLRYEQEAYESMQKVMPSVGKEFNTPDGPGIVLENNVITETTKLKITLPDGTFDVRSYPFRELTSTESDCGCGSCCCGENSDAGCEAVGEAAVNENAASDEKNEENAQPRPTKPSYGDRRPSKPNSGRPAVQHQRKLRPAEQSEDKSRDPQKNGANKKFRRFNGSHPRKQGLNAQSGGKRSSDRPKAPENN
ncbi:MAG: stage 0 sporulation family protein [Clostridia bacterium]|nr:stage 0 sporulation family protein [Clostridia bacterium]